MSEPIKNLIDAYTQWLRDNIQLREIRDNWVEITTPYLDRHNDHLQIYAKQTQNGFLLTDDGYIINDLISAGCLLDSPKRKELLSITLAGFGVHLNEDQLEVQTTSHNFPAKKHALIQAMLAVNDLFYLASPYVSSLFFEDVMAWMDLSDIRYTPKVKFTGKTGYDHMFDFVIPKSRNSSERVVQTLNNPKKDAAENLVFKWIDTRETRSSGSILYPILNDTHGPISPLVIDAFKAYEIEPIFWSQRNDAMELLVA